MSDTIAVLTTPFCLFSITKIQVSGPLAQTFIKKYFGKAIFIAHWGFLANYKAASE
jgi:hypothetical protein